MSRPIPIDPETFQTLYCLFHEQGAESISVYAEGSDDSALVVTDSRRLAQIRRGATPYRTTTTTTPPPSIGGPARIQPQVDSTPPLRDTGPPANPALISAAPTRTPRAGGEDCRSEDGPRDTPIAPRESARGTSADAEEHPRAPRLRPSPKEGRGKRRRGPTRTALAGVGSSSGEDSEEPTGAEGRPPAAKRPRTPGRRGLRGKANGALGVGEPEEDSEESGGRASVGGEEGGGGPGKDVEGRVEGASAAPRGPRPRKRASRLSEIHVVESNEPEESEGPKEPEPEPDEPEQGDTPATGPEPASGGTAVVALSPAALVRLLGRPGRMHKGAIGWEPSINAAAAQRLVGWGVGFAGVEACGALAAALRALRSRGVGRRRLAPRAPSPASRLPTSPPEAPAFPSARQNQQWAASLRSAVDELAASRDAGEEQAALSFRVRLGLCQLYDKTLEMETLLKESPTCVRLVGGDNAVRTFIKTHIAAHHPRRSGDSEKAHSKTVQRIIRYGRCLYAIFTILGFDGLCLAPEGIVPPASGAQRRCVILAHYTRWAELVRDYHPAARPLVRTRSAILRPYLDPLFTHKPLPATRLVLEDIGGGDAERALRHIDELLSPGDEAYSSSSSTPSRPTSASRPLGLHPSAFPLRYPASDPAGHGVSHAVRHPISHAVNPPASHPAGRVAPDPAGEPASTYSSYSSQGVADADLLAVDPGPNPSQSSSTTSEPRRPPSVAYVVASQESYAPPRRSLLSPRVYSVDEVPSYSAVGAQPGRLLAGPLHDPDVLSSGAGMLFGGPGSYHSFSDSTLQNDDPN